MSTKPSFTESSDTPNAEDILPINGPARHRFRLADLLQAELSDWPPDDTWFDTRAEEEIQRYWDWLSAKFVWSPYPILSYCLAGADAGAFSESEEKRKMVALLSGENPYAEKISVRYYLFPTRKPSVQNQAVAQLICAFDPGCRETDIKVWVDALREDELEPTNLEDIRAALQMPIPTSSVMIEFIISDELRNKTTEEERVILQAAMASRDGDDTLGDTIVNVVEQKWEEGKDDPDQFRAIYAYAKTRHMLDRHNYLLELSRSEKDLEQEMRRVAKLATVNPVTLMSQYFAIPDPRDRFSWAGRLGCVESKWMYDTMQIIVLHPGATYEKYKKKMADPATGKILSVVQSGYNENKQGMPPISSGKESEPSYSEDKGNIAQDQTNSSKSRVGLYIAIAALFCLGLIFYKSVLRSNTTSGPGRPPKNEQEITSAESNVIDSNSVWKPLEGKWEAIDEKCRGNISCIISSMRAEGASQKAIEFTKLMKGEFYMSSFREMGKVDLAEITRPLLNDPNVTESILVNGSPTIIELWDKVKNIDISRDGGYGALARRFPDIMLLPMHGFEAMQLLPTGGQRFIFNFALLNGCRACEDAGGAQIAFDFDGAGRLSGVGLLRLTGP